MTNNGIKEFADKTFRDLLPQRAVIGNMAFRKAVREAIMTKFAPNVSGSSASTYYNNAFIEVKKAITAGDAMLKALVGDLGRAEGKNNGGPKPKAEAVLTVATTPAKTPKVTQPVAETSPALTQGVRVLRKDGTLLGTFASVAAAQEVVEKARTSKKAGLILDLS
jgi:hypothetical protein